MMQKSLFIFLIFFSTYMKGQPDLPVYQFYDRSGKPVSYSQVVENVSKADVVLFGEIHDDPIHHWMQLQLSHDLLEETNNQLILGAEMFEADDQLPINEYLSNIITHDHLQKAIKTWNNYTTDYRPLIEFAHDNKLKFIASNIPRRYASLVSREGIKILDTLSGQAKKYIAPLPVEVTLKTPGYKEMKEIAGMHGKEMNIEYFIQAQAIKDATMAYFISENWKENHTLLHFNGNFHSGNYGGIYWYLKKYNPDLNVKTIASKRNKNLEFDDDFNDEADYVLITPPDMIRTF